MTWWVSCILDLLLYIPIGVVIIPDPPWDIMIKLTKIKMNFPHQLGISFLYWCNTTRIPKCPNRSHRFKFNGSTTAPLYQSIPSSALETRAFNPADPRLQRWETVMTRACRAATCWTLSADEGSHTETMTVSWHRWQGNLNNLFMQLTCPDSAWTFPSLNRDSCSWVHWAMLLGKGAWWWKMYLALNSTASDLIWK